MLPNSRALFKPTIPKKKYPQASYCAPKLARPRLRFNVQYVDNIEL